jgi:predicted MFS family arabinose efflux permease
MEVTQARKPWFPMVVVALGQVTATMNLNFLPVSIGGIVNEFGAAPTAVSTAIVVYSIAVAGFIMLGAKLGKKYGSTRIFRLAAAVLLLAAVLVTFSPGMNFLIAAQGVAGLGAALIMPALVVQISHEYDGPQKAQAIGILGAVQAGATVAAFFLAGVLGTQLGWRYAFGLIIPLAALTLYLSGRLRPVQPQTGIGLDGVGIVLCAAAVVLLSLGVDRISSWGLLLAKSDAPVSLFGLSPALVVIVLGVFAIQLFLAWCQRRQRSQRTPLLPPEVLRARSSRTAVVALMAIVMIGSGLNFLVPLYIQMVQGRTSLETAAALVPYQLAVLAASLLVAGLYERMSPRGIARYAFAVVALALTALAFTVRNEWSNQLVIAALVMAGLGQGALLTLLFTLLLSSAPQWLVGDVGALRGAARNLANGVGTALSGALVVGLLGANLHHKVHEHPQIPTSLIDQVNLNRPAFLSNEQLEVVLARTTATPRQREVAAEINAEARLRALKLTLMFLAGLALLMVVPVRGLPGGIWIPGRAAAAEATKQAVS